MKRGIKRSLRVANARQHLKLALDILDVAKPQNETLQVAAIELNRAAIEIGEAMVGTYGRNRVNILVRDMKRQKRKRAEEAAAAGVATPVDLDPFDDDPTPDEVAAARAAADLAEEEEEDVAEPAE